MLQMVLLWIKQYGIYFLILKVWHVDAMVFESNSVFWMVCYVFLYKILEEIANEVQIK